MDGKTSEAFRKKARAKMPRNDNLQTALQGSRAVCAAVPYAVPLPRQLLHLDAFLVELQTSNRALIRFYPKQAASTIAPTDADVEVPSRTTSSSSQARPSPLQYLLIMPPKGSTKLQTPSNRESSIDKTSEYEDFMRILTEYHEKRGCVPLESSY